MAENKKRSHHKKPSPPKKAAKKKIPRQDPLPGMGDAKITAIENTALDYAEVRDERQTLTTREVELKTKLLDLMHKSGKTTYKRNGISVTVVPEGEKVKVRVKEESDEPISAPTPESQPETQEEEVAVEV